MVFTRVLEHEISKRVGASGIDGDGDVFLLRLQRELGRSISPILR